MPFAAVFSSLLSMAAPPDVEAFPVRVPAGPVLLVTQPDESTGTRREALWLVEDGVASPEDIDAAVRYGFGFRFLACGPLLQKEMSGWDVHLRAAATVYPSLCTEPLPPPSFVPEWVWNNEV